MKNRNLKETTKRAVSNSHPAQRWRYVTCRNIGEIGDVRYASNWKFTALLVL